MKVYVVLYNPAGDGDELLGVYSSQDAALQYIKSKCYPEAHSFSLTGSVVKYIAPVMKWNFDTKPGQLINTGREQEHWSAYTIVEKDVL